jgi:hypothetical protein
MYIKPDDSKGTGEKKPKEIIIRKLKTDTEVM